MLARRADSEEMDAPRRATMLARRADSEEVVDVDALLAEAALLREEIAEEEKLVAAAAETLREARAEADAARDADREARDAAKAVFKAVRKRETVGLPASPCFGVGRAPEIRDEERLFLASDARRQRFEIRPRKRPRRVGVVAAARRQSSLRIRISTSRPRRRRDHRRKSSRRDDACFDRLSRRRTGPRLARR